MFAEMATGKPGRTWEERGRRSHLEVNYKVHVKENTHTCLFGNGCWSKSLLNAWRARKSECEGD